MKHQELLAASYAQLTDTRGQLHACQGKLETLEQHFQNSQDQLHQLTAELQVSCVTCMHLLHLWSFCVERQKKESPKKGLEPLTTRLRALRSTN